MPSATSYLSFDDVVRPDMLSEEFPALLSAPQINWLLRNREHNGLKDAGAVLKVGGKLYLSREKFMQWFYTQQA